MKAAPCVECGTKGGHARRGGKPSRIRGLCQRCYWRLWSRCQLPPRTHERTPRKPAKVQPCTECGTKKGPVKSGCVTPMRDAKGRCNTCYHREYYRRKRDQAKSFTQETWQDRLAAVKAEKIARGEVR